MNRKHLLTGLFFTGMILAISCNNSGADKNKETTSADNAASGEEGTNPKGIGPHKNVQLTHPLDQTMIAQGQNIYNVKCASCHKLTNEKLVGPGWKGVTDRRTPEWIMNFITNTEEMLQKDTAAINLLEVCLVKMPNQNLSENDARSVLEFIRNNDSKQ